ncbi:MAG: hypothetical protein V3573_11995 [Desulfovibrionaceae bacterium]
MEGYKKFILFGCVFLVGGYFLPWLSNEGQITSGYSLLQTGYDLLRPMYESGMYDRTFVMTYAIIALPALGAVLSFFYCMIKPDNGNGLIATLLFLLPILTLGSLYGYYHLYAEEGGKAVQLLRHTYAALETSLFDLQSTGGLWLVHLGAVIMFLGRLSRSNRSRHRL